MHLMVVERVAGGNCERPFLTTDFELNDSNLAN